MTTATCTATDIDANTRTAWEHARIIAAAQGGRVSAYYGLGHLIVKLDAAANKPAPVESAESAEPVVVPVAPVIDSEVVTEPPRIRPMSVTDWVYSLPTPNEEQRINKQQAAPPKPYKKPRKKRVITNIYERRHIRKEAAVRQARGDL